MEYKTGMYSYALAFLAGVITVQQLDLLPEAGLLVTALLSCFLLVIFTRFILARSAIKVESTLIIVHIILIIIGIIYASMYANQRLSVRLDEAFAGKNLLVSGYVANIPVNDESVQRFEFVIEKYHDFKAGSKKGAYWQANRELPGKIRLSWYHANQKVKSAEKWQLEVRLKTPHGFMNPGGFDYEAWLFQHGIGATGYVRKSQLNQRLQPQISTALIPVINQHRQALIQKIDAIANNINTGPSDQGNAFALVKALAVGDKSAISTRQWRVLVNTGISHLMAISGLHIGLASLFVYVLIRRLVPVFIMKRVPAQHVAIVSGMLFALLYAMLAGFSVPTQRAIIMLCVVSVFILIRHNHRPFDVLGLALFLVLALDPLAVLSAGFWFSFSAVAVIFLGFNSTESQSPQKKSIWRTVLSTVKQWTRLQLLISVLLLPMSLFMFQQVSLISPLVNFLLIPYVSFLVVPVILVAIACSYILPALSEILFVISANLLDLVWPVLSWLSVQPYAIWVQGDTGIYKTLIATSALLLLFFSGRVSGFIDTVFCQKLHDETRVYAVRAISVLLLVSIVYAPSHETSAGDFSLAVLDVGQGSAAVIKTQNHALVFDAGAKFSDRLDAGRSVVIPYLRKSGIRKLDYLIVSHGDADHIGGAQAILDDYPAVVIGQDIDRLRAEQKYECYQGLKWHWDGVDFRFLSPEKNARVKQTTARRNNRSCVLSVKSKSGSVLFTGDIENRVERKLLKKYGRELAADILIVPHHGSKTSSGMDFITTIDPELSVFSVGYKNRYRFPNDKILKRYKQQGSELMQTDISGAIMVDVTGKDGIVIEKYRETAAKYWHHDVSAELNNQHKNAIN